MTEDAWSKDNPWKRCNDGMEEKKEETVSCVTD